MPANDYLTLTIWIIEKMRESSNFLFTCKSKGMDKPNTVCPCPCFFQKRNAYDEKQLKEI